MACGTLVPQPDIEPMPRMLEGWALTPGPRRKSPPSTFEKATFPICHVAPLSPIKWLFMRSLFQDQFHSIHLFVYPSADTAMPYLRSSYQVLTSSTVFFSTSAVFFEDALIILGLWFSYQFQKSVWNWNDTESGDQCGEGRHNLTASATVWRTLLLPLGGHANRQRLWKQAAVHSSRASISPVTRQFHS